MKKFYLEPSMDVKNFNAENIVTASGAETQNTTVGSFDENYSTVTGTIAKTESGISLTF